jgi:TolB-like protein/class 3 adenylate cyclase
LADSHSRKLVVILHADVVDSTALVQRNESLAHEGIQASFRLFSATIENYGGMTREIRGDALVAEFSRTSDAVSAALAFQELQDQPGVDETLEIRPRLRVGISLGEVIIADQTVTGAGVVLAQRLEQLAEPGGVVVQGSVSETVPDRMPFEFESLGEQNLKGFVQSFRAFKVRLQSGASIPEPEAGAMSDDNRDDASPGAQSTNLPDKPSIVVLPFSNMSSDPEQEYFSDGVSEDIITDLSKLAGLFVIARNSAFAYKGKAVNVPEICRELAVRFALEGSIRKAGNRVRITAQLIDGATGGHIWADRYDRELADIFEVQDEVTREIVQALAPHLIDSGPPAKSRQPTQNLEAYDYFLRGRSQWWLFTRESNLIARQMFEQAINLDPNFATAIAWLGACHMVEFVNDWSEDPEKSVARHAELVRQAVALDENDPFARAQLGLSYLIARKHDQAIKEAEHALELDPNFAHCHLDLAWFYYYSGRFDEALTVLGNLERLDPLFPDMNLQIQALAEFQLGRYEDALKTLKRRIIRNPNSDVAYVTLASCHGHLGNFKEARKSWRNAHKINPNYSIEYKRKSQPYRNPADFEHIVDGLRKADIDPTKSPRPA